MITKKTKETFKMHIESRNTTFPIISEAMIALYCGLLELMTTVSLKFDSNLLLLDL